MRKHATVVAADEWLNKVIHQSPAFQAQVEEELAAIIASRSVDFETYGSAHSVIPVPHAVFPASIRPFFDDDIVRDSRQHGLVSI